MLSFTFQCVNNIEAPHALCTNLCDLHDFKYKVIVSPVVSCIRIFYFSSPQYNMLLYSLVGKVQN